MANSTPITTAKMAACVSANRKPALRTSLGRLMDRVAGTADGVDQVGLPRTVDLGAQTADVRLDDAGLGIEMELPDLLQEHAAGDDPAGMAHQEFEQHELARLELDRPARPRCLPT